MICAVLVGLVFGLDFGVAQQETEYLKWLQQEEQKLQQYKDERDAAFTNFLKQEWEKMQAMAGLAPDLKPKPVKIPAYEPPVVPPTKPEPTAETVVPDITVPPPPVPEVKPAPQVEPEAGQVVDLHYFNQDYRISLLGDFQIRPITAVDEDQISNFWSDMSLTEYDATLKHTNRLRNNLALNDWGYILLLKSLASRLFDRSPEQDLFVWFMLNKDGYRVKTGYYNNSVYLLFPSKTVIYGVPYFTLQGQRYYILPLDAKQTPSKTLYTYQGDYPGADKPIELTISQIPNLGNRLAKRTLRVLVDDEIKTLSFEYNQSLVDFFRNYPQTDLEVYFDAQISSIANYSLLTSLKPIVEGRSERQAVDILLHLVQTGFDYKTDDQQFGREKFFFPEETLYYPFSDCEDRSILFAYLVRNLLNLPVIGLDYPGHVATAVRFTDPQTGDRVKHNGVDYLICDPTYINAESGICMPQLKDVQPRIVALR
jgi:hypothetical protein